MATSFLPRTIPKVPPVPVLYSVLPRRWWSQKGWPDPNYRTGMNWTFAFHGENFTPDSVIMLGTRAVRPDRGSPHELQAWIVPPVEPVTLLIRVRTGMFVSNPLSFTFR